ncbi:hypothetical protein [Sphingomonas yabuuchiae]|uniref:Uncharacterized protein n=1 Tax=Sphingomonas yabuuchiae TaxID=172044 RepID=A0AA41A284_9SPHN|nr:hypothetical protein [Sphingomonas yabuuchiae]MBB4609418.1 hypothetical protein [Sphingomonas yabuuchiae]MBN3560327.1 hypothetical protein [Sphingomonas yabuuchiae]
MTFTAMPPQRRFGPAWIGGAVGLFAILLVMIVPDWRLESLVSSLSLGDILAAARPPLGMKARVLLALVAGLGAGAVTWAVVYLLWGPGGLLARRAKPVRDDDDEDYVPAVRRSDRHPDAPPRRPLNAAELGAPPPPLEEDIVERTLPADLDQPLSAYDPEAILSTPREPMRPAPAEPMPIPPMREPAPEERGAALPLPDRQDESIETMLDRLERETALRKAQQRRI